MASTECLVCLVNTVGGHCKNALGRGSASSGLITKLEQSTFLRHLCTAHFLSLYVYTVISIYMPNSSYINIGACVVLHKVGKISGLCALTGCTMGRIAGSIVSEIACVFAQNLVHVNEP